MDTRDTASLRLSLVAVLSLLVGLAFADTPAPPIPDTPAGRTLALWLDAFNGGDRARVEEFIKRYFPQWDLDQAMSYRAVTGGFDLLTIEMSEETRLAFRLRRRSGLEEEIGTIRVTDAVPAVISSLWFSPFPPGARFEEITLDAAARARLIDGAAATVEALYVFPDVGKRLAAALRAGEKQGKYAAIADGDAFASRLTHGLREISHDQWCRARKRRSESASLRHHRSHRP